MNNRVINGTIAVAFFNLYQAVSSVALNYISKFLVTDPGDSIVHHFHRFIVYSIIDLVTALALLYLFFELEQLSKRYKSDPLVIEKNIDLMRPNHGT